MTVTPMLAVYMITYNHQDYIDQAIASVMNQRTNFSFQLFIGDDASTDGTFQKCAHWREKYPDQIVLLDASVNFGVFANASRVFEACIQSGARYIALLEGDDYWTNLDKLQRQVDILESDDNIAGSYHNTEFLYSDGMQKPMKKSLPTVLQLKDVISKYAPFHTSSFVFRAKHFCRPSWFKKIDSVDLAMYVWHAQFGRLEGINEVMSAYRIHTSSLTASENHRVNFDDRRVVLHRMMRGKIDHVNDDQYKELIQFHEQNSLGEWRKSLQSSIVFFFPFQEHLPMDVKSFRMFFDAEILNCSIVDDTKIRAQNRSYRYYKNFVFWNKWQWRRVSSDWTQSIPHTLVFIREQDFKVFKKLVGPIKAKVILLYPIPTENLIDEKKSFVDLISLDWNNWDDASKLEFVRNWNLLNADREE
jgi:glycosyltransferase involved in cell wall biosynthesis